jgi:hypothetical protein
LTWDQVQFCTGAWEERTWAHGAEESPLLEAVAREKLVKTKQAGKSLAGDNLWIVDIRRGAVITCIFETYVKMMNKSINQSKPRL